MDPGILILPQPEQPPMPLGPPISFTHPAGAASISCTSPASLGLSDSSAVSCGTESALEPARDPAHDSGDAVSHVRKLADLNVRLYEYASALPPVTMMASEKVPSLEGRLFAIDETFRMTQSLIDLLRTLYPRDGPASDLRSDQGTLLLIMSCSNRVFDIYEVIFSHMRGCVQHNITPITPVTSDGKTIVLPQLRIGSFAPPAPSAFAIHMLLIVMMASTLFDQLRDVLGLAAYRVFVLSTRELGKKISRLSEEAGSELVKRAGVVAGEIGNTRRVLLDVAGLSGAGGGWSTSGASGALGNLRALQQKRNPQKY